MIWFTQISNPEKNEKKKKKKKKKKKILIKTYYQLRIEQRQSVHFHGETRFEKLIVRGSTLKGKNLLPRGVATLEEVYPKRKEFAFMGSGHSKRGLL